MDKLEVIKRQSERSHRRDAEDQTFPLYQGFNALPERLHELRAYKDLIQLTRKYIPEKRLVDLPGAEKKVQNRVQEFSMIFTELDLYQRVLYKLQENAWSDERCNDYLTAINLNQLSPDDEVILDDTYYLLSEKVRILPECENFDFFIHIPVIEKYATDTFPMYKVKVDIIQKISKKVSNILSHAEIVDMNPYLNWIVEFKQLLPTLHADVLDLTVYELDRIKRELRHKLSNLTYVIARA
jgi:hypothetical protein